MAMVLIFGEEVMRVLCKCNPQVRRSDSEIGLKFGLSEKIAEVYGKSDIVIAIVLFFWGGESYESLMQEWALGGKIRL